MKGWLGALAACVLCADASPAAAATDAVQRSPTAVVLVAAFFAITAATTLWSARRSRSSSEFYAAAGTLRGSVNGIAIAGDFLSAATLLGIIGLYFVGGYDAAIYVLTPICGLAIVLFLISKPFRQLGRFTVADVVSTRFPQRGVRVFVATTSLVIVLMYLVAQFVGAGALVQLLFRVPFEAAVAGVGLAMVLYVAFGGMFATTWVQVIKAVLMLATILIIAAASLARFDFDIALLYRSAAAAHPSGADFLRPGGLLTDGVSVVSLSVAFILGFVGMPHLLVRLFTVPDEHQARTSVFYAAIIIAINFALIFLVIGVAAIALVGPDPASHDAAGQLIGGSNLAVVHLSRILGGDLLFGLVSAVALATILAVVAGLTIAGVGAISHDIYGQVFRGAALSEREGRIVTKVATFLIGGLAVGAAYLFKDKNVAYLTSMVFAVAASANFVVIILTLYWSGLTARGLIAGGSAGLISSIVLIVLGQSVWVDILGNPVPIFPYEYPAIFTVPLAFGVAMMVSLAETRVARRRPAVG